MSKLIPGSDPNMYVDSDGTVRDRFFSKIPPTICPETGDLHTMVGGKKAYIAELVVELHTEHEKPSGTPVVVFADGNRRNLLSTNLSWGNKARKKDVELNSIPEAGRVESREVKDIPVDDGVEDADVAMEMSKKEMVIEVYKLNNAFTERQVQARIRQTYGTSVTLNYIRSVKNEIGI